MTAVRIRYATADDRDWLKMRDVHVVSEAWLERCLDLGEYIIAEQSGERIGFLRFSLFWGVIPYMDMIGVDAPLRRQGIGAALVVFWEQEMHSRGAKLIMTSAQANEPEAVAWHQKNGFAFSGEMSFRPLQAPAELFMTKPVS